METGVDGERTTLMGIAGAFGNMNFTSSNFCRRRQFSARKTQPAPLSPRPCAIITVAVCRLMAGMMRGFLVVMVADLRSWEDRGRS